MNKMIMIPFLIVKYINKYSDMDIFQMKIKVYKLCKYYHKEMKQYLPDIIFKNYEAEDYRIM